MTIFSFPSLSLILPLGRGGVGESVASASSFPFKLTMLVLIEKVDDVPAPPTKGGEENSKSETNFYYLGKAD